MHECEQEAAPLGGTFTAIQYATGRPIRRQSSVPAMPIQSVFWNVAKNVRRHRLRVAVEREDVVGVGPKMPGLVAEAEPDDHRDRRDEEE